MEKPTNIYDLIIFLQLKRPELNSDIGAFLSWFLSTIRSEMKSDECDQESLIFVYLFIAAALDYSKQFPENTIHEN